MVNSNDAVIEFLLNQLRQQLTNNPYKQQCEDLAHGVQSLKNQLRDASALVAELQETIKLMNEDFNRVTNHGGPLPKGKSYVVGEHGHEQSGCRKEDVQECEHSWNIMPGLFLSEGNPNNVPSSELCAKCGKREWNDKEYKPKNDTQECEHEWVEFHGLFIADGDPRNEPGYTFCRKCGLKEYSRKCEHEWSYVMGDGPGFYECDVCGARSETLPYDLRWLA